VLGRSFSGAKKKTRVGRNLKIGDTPKKGKSRARSILKTDAERKHPTTKEGKKKRKKRGRWKSDLPPKSEIDLGRGQSGGNGGAAHVVWGWGGGPSGAKQLIGDH